MYIEEYLRDSGVDVIPPVFRNPMVLHDYELAAQSLAGKMRKSYFNPESAMAHSVRVALSMADDFYSDPFAVSAALLHDVPEDSGVHVAVLPFWGVDPKVANIVDWVTEDHNLPLEQRKEAYVEKIARPDAPITAQVLSVRDKFDFLSVGIAEIRKLVKEISMPIPEAQKAYFGLFQSRREFIDYFFDQFYRQVVAVFNTNHDWQTLHDDFGDMLNEWFLHTDPRAHTLPDELHWQ